MKTMDPTIDSAELLKTIGGKPMSTKPKKLFWCEGVLEAKLARKKAESARRKKKHQQSKSRKKNRK